MIASVEIMSREAIATCNTRMQTPVSSIVVIGEVKVGASSPLKPMVWPLTTRGGGPRKWMSL